MVGASTLLQPNSTEGTTASGLKTRERGRDHRTGHLAHDRATAREVGRAVGQLRPRSAVVAGLGENPSSAYAA